MRVVIVAAKPRRKDALHILLGRFQPQLDVYVSLHGEQKRHLRVPRVELSDWEEHSVRATALREGVAPREDEWIEAERPRRRDFLRALRGSLLPRVVAHIGGRQRVACNGVTSWLLSDGRFEPPSILRHRPLIPSKLAIAPTHL